MLSVFISYRRSDAAGYASWIYDRLETELGADHVFMDVDSLPLGEDFVAHLRTALSKSDVALVLIGPGWLHARNEDGVRRLDDPQDFVRMEITEVLRANVRVIPVLVDGAEMPKSSLLPSELTPLLRRQGLSFQRHGGMTDLLAQITSLESDPPATWRSSQTQQARVGIDSQPDVAREAPARRSVSLRASSRASDKRESDNSLIDAQRGWLRRLDRRGRLALAAVTVVVAVAVALVVNGDLETAAPTSRIAVGNHPDVLAAGDGNIWVANLTDETLTRINSSTGTVIGSPVPVGNSPEAIAAGAGSVWVANVLDKTVTRINETSGAILDTIHVGSQPGGVAVGAGNVWVTHPLGRTISRISASSGALNRVPIHVDNPGAVAFSQGSLWVASGASDTVTRIDAASGRVSAPIPVGHDPDGVAVADGNVWVINVFGDSVTEINAESGKTVTTLPVGDSPEGIAIGLGSVWVANNGSNTVTRIDTSTGTVLATIRVGDHPRGVVVGADHVWVADAGDNTVTRISVQGHRGT
jgi:YVTN family beta-propeller protein